MLYRLKLRRLWLAVHLYSGLALGGLFALLGLTGAILVFYLDVDPILTPGIRVHTTVHSMPSAEAIFQKIQNSYPERTGPWRIEMPLAADGPVMARYYKPAERLDRSFSPLMLTLDPSSLKITSSRFWGDYFVTWIYDLHYTLLFDKTGKTVVGISGLIMLVSLLSGLYLWWPSRNRLLTALALKLRHGTVRRTYDMHVLGGVYSWIILVVLALSGSALALPDTTRALLEKVTIAETQTPLLIEPGVTTVDKLGLDEAVRIAQRKFPNAEVRWIETSGSRGNAVSVRFYQKGDPGRRFPRTQVWMHPLSGEILATRDSKTESNVEMIMSWLHPLHNGEALGLTGRILVLIAGFLPTLLLITGMMRWRQKVRARRSARLLLST